MSGDNRGLEIRDLTVAYGGLIANDRVALDVRRGQIVGLIGPNGAGKSTMVDAVSGFVPYQGNVTLGGYSLDRCAAHRRKQLGLARTWQSVELFDDLTVRANIDVADNTVTVASFLYDMFNPRRARHDDHVDRVLALVGLEEAVDCHPSELSLGQRKRLGIGRALAGSPLAILLDEPAAGLDAVERQQFAALLGNLAEQGLAVLLIEHDVDLVLKTCDRVGVLDFGVVIACGLPAEVRGDARVAAAYLGTRGDDHISSTSL
jgi:ABC-type branched-subunit amino acid transport system ATPase component